MCRTAVMMPLLLLLLGAGAQASAEPVKGYRGLFLRSSAGLGYAHLFGSDILGGSASLGGVSAALDLDLGGFFFRRLAISAQLSGVGSVLPVGSLGGIGRHGIAATWYFLDSSTFLTGSFRFLAIGGVQSSTTIGVGGGFDIGFGKEWLLSPSWGIGLKGYLFYDAMLGLFLGFLPSSSWNVVGGGLAMTFAFHQPAR